MVKVHTIEMLEHSAKNFPTLKAHTDMINGSLVGMGDGVTAAPVSGSPVYVILNQQVGDNEYKEDYPIAKDTYVNLYDVKAWEGKELDVSDSNIAYDGSEKYSDIVKGTELTFDPDTFKFKIGVSSAGDVGFVVTGKWGQIVNGVTVKVVVK